MTQTIPTQETALAVQSTPPVIVFDFEAAEAAVKASLEKYNGLVVSEDTTVEIKKDMADLNKQKAALADAPHFAIGHEQKIAVAKAHHFGRNRFGTIIWLHMAYRTQRAFNARRYQSLLYRFAG